MCSLWYDLEVEVMSNASEQKDTSDYDEPEDVYAKDMPADQYRVTISRAQV